MSGPRRSGLSSVDDIRRVWVLDGGLATELERRGHDIANDRLWSARLLHSDPEAILDVHKSYLDNGADIIITASYQASVEGFCSELGVSEDKALNLIGRSVAIAKEARKQHTSQKKDIGRMTAPLIAGSVGPYGAHLHDGSEYTGDYVDHMTKQELQRWHRPRLKELIDNGVDIIAFETIPALLEGRVLLELLHNEFSNTKAWITFSCKDGERTCHGELFTDVVSTLVEYCKREQIIAIGINCTPPHHIQSLLRCASHVPDIMPLIVYPNSGESWNTHTHSWSGKAMSLSSEALSWIQSGARYIGGCCRVGPHDIQDLRHTIDKYHDSLKI